MIDNRLCRLLVPTALALTASAASAQYAAAGTCNAKPKYAYNGQVLIKYPNSASHMQGLRQVCNASTTAAAKKLLAEARSKGITIKYIEFYEALRWNHSFGDLIYKLRPRGYAQTNYKSWKETATYPESNTLIYANDRTGKYVGRIRIGDNVHTSFVVFGN